MGNAGNQVGQTSPANRTNSANSANRTNQTSQANQIRREGALSLARGLLSAVGLTVVGMAGLALLVVYAQLGDGTLMLLNQALKLAAILLGAWRAVGPGGSRGFALGAVIGLVYIALGYGVCALWDGLMIGAGMLVVEFLTGALLGGIGGALIANLPAGRGRARKRAARARG